MSAMGSQYCSQSLTGFDDFITQSCLHVVFPFRSAAHGVTGFSWKFCFRQKIGESAAQSTSQHLGVCRHGSVKTESGLSGPYQSCAYLFLSLLFKVSSCCFAAFDDSRLREITYLTIFDWQAVTAQEEKESPHEYGERVIYMFYVHALSFSCYCGHGSAL